MPGWYGIRSKIKVQFQDVLALLIVVPFLIFTALVATRGVDIEILRIFVPLVSIILGGYFGQGAIQQWQTGKKEEKPPMEGV